MKIKIIKENNILKKGIRLLRKNTRKIKNFLNIYVQIKK